MSSLLQDMGVYHGGCNILMPEQGLDGSYVCAPFQKMGGETMAKGMGRDSLF